MNELIGVGLLLTAIVGGLLALAPRVSESLVRSRARRLPHRLSERMGEEWLAELGALPGRPSQLAFAIALMLTRRHSFAMDDDSLFAAPARSPLTSATFGGWRSVVVFTTIFAAAIAYAVSFLIAPLYRSHARVIVVPQRVSARFVEPGGSRTLDGRLRAISPSVLSRRRLEDLILQFDLYRADRGLPASERKISPANDLPMQNRLAIDDAAIERMRKDIDVDVDADGQSFEIAYVSPDPQVAMNVTVRLTALFIETSLRDREAVSDSARQFLDDEIAHVRSTLLKRTPLTLPTNPSEADVWVLEHESLKQTYRDLLRKKEQAIISTNMERRQIAEQFKLLDPARLPETPISPNRATLTLLGAVIGFCLGVAMMLAERNESFRRSKKVLAQS
jgi:uncharacterized protein involved in exopolysaccharide biosynthesis